MVFQIRFSFLKSINSVKLRSLFENKNYFLSGVDKFFKVATFIITFSF